MQPGVAASDPERSVLRTRTPWIVLSLLFLAVIFTFWPATTYDFVAIDDYAYVAQNPVVLKGISGDGTSWAFGFHEANWHPLTWISHMLDAAFFGARPGGPHLVNVVLHGLNACLVFTLFFGLTNAL